MQELIQIESHLEFVFGGKTRLQSALKVIKFLLGRDTRDRQFNARFVSLLTNDAIQLLAEYFICKFWLQVSLTIETSCLNKTFGFVISDT